MSEADVIRHQEHHGFRKPSVTAPGSPVAASKPLRLPKQPNKTEREYGLILEAMKQKGEIDEYAFEPFSLRYGDNAYYKPDYVTLKGGRLTMQMLTDLCQLPAVELACDPNLFWALQGLGEDMWVGIIEIKGGRIYPEAKPRFKAAKLHHKWAHFELHQKKQGSWARLL